MTYRRFSFAVTRALGSPYAIGVALAGIGGWLGVGPLFHWSDAWNITGNSALSVAALLMTLILQHSLNRDSDVVNEKLDQQVEVDPRLPNDVVGLQYRPDEEVRPQRGQGADR